MCVERVRERESERERRESIYIHTSSGVCVCVCNKAEEIGTDVSEHGVLMYYYIY